MKDEQLKYIEEQLYKIIQTSFRLFTQKSGKNTSLTTFRISNIKNLGANWSRELLNLKSFERMSCFKVGFKKGVFSETQFYIPLQPIIFINKHMRNSQDTITNDHLLITSQIVEAFDTFLKVFVQRLSYFSGDTTSVSSFDYSECSMFDAADFVDTQSEFSLLLESEITINDKPLQFQNIMSFRLSDEMTDLMKQFSIPVFSDAKSEVSQSKKLAIA